MLYVVANLKPLWSDESTSFLPGSLLRWDLDLAFGASGNEEKKETKWMWAVGIDDQPTDSLNWQLLQGPSARRRRRLTQEYLFPQPQNSPAFFRYPFHWMTHAVANVRWVAQEERALLERVKYIRLPGWCNRCCTAPVNIWATKSPPWATFWPFGLFSSQQK